MDSGKEHLNGKKSDERSAGKLMSRGIPTIQVNSGNSIHQVIAMASNEVETAEVTLAKSEAVSVTVTEKVMEAALEDSGKTTSTFSTSFSFIQQPVKQFSTKTDFHTDPFGAPSSATVLVKEATVGKPTDHTSILTGSVTSSEEKDSKHILKIRVSPSVSLKYSSPKEASSSDVNEDTYFIINAEKSIGNNQIQNNTKVYITNNTNNSDFHENSENKKCIISNSIINSLNSQNNLVSSSSVNNNNCNIEEEENQNIKNSIEIKSSLNNNGDVKCPILIKTETTTTVKVNEKENQRESDECILKTTFLSSETEETGEYRKSLPKVTVISLKPEISVNTENVETAPQHKTVTKRKEIVENIDKKISTLDIGRDLTGNIFSPSLLANNSDTEIIKSENLVSKEPKDFDRIPSDMVQKTNDTDLMDITNAPNYLFYATTTSGQCSPSDTLDSGTCSDLENGNGGNITNCFNTGKHSVHIDESHNDHHHHQHYNGNLNGHHDISSNNGNNHCLSNVNTDNSVKTTVVDIIPRQQIGGGINFKTPMQNMIILNQEDPQYNHRHHHYHHQTADRENNFHEDDDNNYVTTNGTDHYKHSTKQYHRKLNSSSTTSNGHIRTGSYTDSEESESSLSCDSLNSSSVECAGHIPLPPALTSPEIVTMISSSTVSSKSSIVEKKTILTNNKNSSMASATSDSLTSFQALKAKKQVAIKRNFNNTNTVNNNNTSNNSININGNNDNKMLKTFLPDSLLKDIRDRNFSISSINNNSNNDNKSELKPENKNELLNKEITTIISEPNDCNVNLVNFSKIVNITSMNDKDYYYNSGSSNHNKTNHNNNRTCVLIKQNYPSENGFHHKSQHDLFSTGILTSAPSSASATNSFEDDKFYTFHLNEKDISTLVEREPKIVQDETFAGFKDICSGSSTIRSSKGTVRGVKNRVRNGIATFLQMQQNNVKNYKEKDSGKVVLYTTSMGIVRETYAKCSNVKQILRTLLVKFEERDVFMSGEYQQEVKERMQSDEINVPQLFVEGQHIGDAEAVERLNESGELRQILKPYKSLDASFTCQVCGGYRLLPCSSCNGSKKSVHRNHFTAEFIALKCMNCDEVGLVKCYSCNA